MTAIDEVRQKTDIVATIGQYTALKKAGRTLRGLCPFHSEKTPSFFVYPEQQTWHCFGCNTGGDVFSFVMKKEALDFKEALRLLADKAGIILPDRTQPAEDKSEKERLHKACEAAAFYFHHLLLDSPAAETARSYLARRGFTPKAISDFQLGVSPDSWDALKQHLLAKGQSEDDILKAGLVSKTDDGRTFDRFRNRLMFPIFDLRGRVTGFGARALDDSQPKYLNSPQTPLFDKSNSLYGINYAASPIRQQEQAVVVEGYVDVIIAHQAGFNNVVASLGTAITDRQVNALKKLTPNVLLALDADSAGEEAMLRCVGYENILEAEIKVVVLPAGKDPDEVIIESSDAWRKLLAEAVPIVDYTFRMVTSGLDFSTAGGKTLAAGRLFPVIAGIKDHIRRDHYLQKLGRLTKIGYNVIELSFEEYLSKQKMARPKGEGAGGRAVRLSERHSLEENCLSLLLQHPELKSSQVEFAPEYFEASENREIFSAWRETADMALLKEKLTPALHERVDALLNRALPADRIEERHADHALRLRERMLRGLEAKKAEALSLEAETGGTAAELEKLREHGIETSLKLGEIFATKSQKRPESRRL